MNGAADQQQPEQLAAVPRLQDFDWRVDLVSASSEASGLHEPSCTLQLTTEQGREMRVQMDRQRLGELVASLGRLRVQLDGLGQQQQTT